MAHFESEYGRDMTYDEFGNPIRRTEDAVHRGVTKATTGHGTHDTTGTGYGTHGTTAGTGYGTHVTATGPTGLAETTAAGQGVTGVPLHRSDGLKEKIKEKLPCGSHKSDAASGATTTPYGGHEKGMMDKIREKLPGQH